MQERLSVGILIPIHNEAATIGDLVRHVRSQGWPVVVVDDGSDDDGASQAEEAGAVVIRHEGRQGKGAALKTGFEWFLSHGFQGVLTMDGDGQHLPEDLVQFSREIEKDGQRVITGNRMADPGPMPWLRRWTNRVMSFFISRLCGQNIPDTQCGYRYIPAGVLRLADLMANDFEIETEILVKAARLGFPIVSVPIQSIYRDEKSKIHPLRDTGRFFRYVWREFRSQA